MAARRLRSVVLVVIAGTALTGLLVQHRGAASGLGPAALAGSSTGPQALLAPGARADLLPLVSVPLALPGTPLPAPVPATAAPTALPATAPAAPLSTVRPAPRPAPQPSAYSYPPLTPQDQQVVDLINQDRAQNGLAPLQVDLAVAQAAAVHAGQNAAQDQMSHAGLVDDVNAQHVVWHSLGECLGYWQGSPNATQINSMWMQSSDHRPIILGQYVRLGVGWARASNGDWFVSAIFVS